MADSSIRLTVANIPRSSIVDIDADGRMTVHEHYRNCYLWSCQPYACGLVLVPKDKTVMLVDVDMHLQCRLPVTVEVYSYKGLADFVRHPAVMDGYLYLINSTGNLMSCKLDDAASQHFYDQTMMAQDVMIMIQQSVQDFCVVRQRSSLYFMTHNGDIYLRREGDILKLVSSELKSRAVGSNYNERSCMAAIDKLVIVCLPGSQYRV